MTKKSDARLARDAEIAREKQDLKNNTCWDDLNKIHDSCAHALLSHVNLAQYSKSQDLIACVVDKDVLTQNIKLLAGDLATMKNELAEIHAQHKGKKGGSRDPDEVFSTIEIAERYNLFQVRHDAVIMPTVLHITEQFAEAELRLKGALEIAKAKEGLTDPSVVSEVEFKEVEPIAGDINPAAPFFADKTEVTNTTTNTPDPEPSQEQ